MRRERRERRRRKVRKTNINYQNTLTEFLNNCNSNCLFLLATILCCSLSFAEASWNLSLCLSLMSHKSCLLLASSSVICWLIGREERKRQKKRGRDLKVGGERRWVEERK